MDRQQFLRYIADNFDISGEAFRFVENIAEFIEYHFCDESEQYSVACELLDGTIGLSDAELKQIAF